MKKPWKILKWLLIVVVSFTLIIILGWNYAMHRKKKRMAADIERLSKICDTIQLITEKPEIAFSGFEDEELKYVLFKIKRGQSIIDSISVDSFLYTSEDGQYKTANIPFKEFKKSDTIIVETPNKLQFDVSGFHRSPELHYGMFGYVGSGDGCFLQKDYVINKSNGHTITKEIAWLPSEKNNRIEVLSFHEEKFKKIADSSAIDLAAAEKIFDENKIEKNNYSSQVFCGMHVERSGNYYIFKEEINSRKADIIKINAENGDYKRYKNYPFD